MKRLSVVCRGSGLSLVEILMAMVIALIVIAAIYKTQTAQTRAYHIQELVAEMQQNARMAMEIIARDVRMAGFEAEGYTVPDSNALVAINRSTGPDGMIISGHDTVASQGLSTTLTADVDVGDGAITVTTVDPNGDGSDDFTENAGVIISNGTNTEGFRIISVAGTTLTFAGVNGSSDTLVNAYLAANTFVAPAIIYDVNTNSLRRNGDALANNIEDLQLAYLFSDGDVWNSPDDTDGDDTNDRVDIRSVRINVLARPSRVDPDFNGRRPAVEDRPEAGSTDHYRRRLLSAVVKVRNMGL